MVACAGQEVNQETEAQELMQLSREWAATASTDDLEKTLSYWDSDAVVMMPGQAAVKGHDAIRKMLEGNANIPGFEVSWEPKEAYVSASGDLGYVIAHNYIKMQGPDGNKITIFNKGVEIWKKQEDGSWKNVVDIFNEDPTLTSIK
jgi:ketosteroid isomerase-like protein